MVVKLTSMMIDMTNFSVVRMMNNSIIIEYKNGSKTVIKYQDGTQMRRDYDALQYKVNNNIQDAATTYAKRMLTKVKNISLKTYDKVKKKYDEIDAVQDTQGLIPKYVSINSKNINLPKLVVGNMYGLSKDGYVMINNEKYVHYSNEHLTKCSDFIY